jgi:hypothetical protein
MEFVDLHELKGWVRSHVPKDNPVRLAVESQPDRVAIDEFLVLLKSWDLMLGIR